MAATSKSTALGRPPRTVRRRFGGLRGILLLIPLAIVILIFVAWVVPTTRWAKGTGFVMTEQEAEIRPSVQGAIERWLVRDGQEVKKEQLLIQLKDSVQRAGCDQVLKELKAVQAQLARLQSFNRLNDLQRREQTFQANRKLEVARGRLEKMQGASSGVFSPHELVEAKLNVDVATSRLAELELPRGEVREKQVAVLKEQIEAARKKVVLYKAEVELRKIRSSLNGMVRLNRFDPGEVIKPDHVLGQVFDTASWIVRLKLSERHIVYVRQGQSVRIKLAAYPSLRYGYLWAVVSRVTPVVSPQATGDGIFYVEARINKKAGLQLRPGLTVRARIEVGRTSWLLRILRL
ncbi:MAG: HlyD family efflux transporter periplasmic adaptor subunit [Phycisphaerae bacterium]|jgi:HlyD family secretion protein|nr:HlyD family efflux transporter periplasmic adaptor subunit [Phycisphaerae bacterium]